MQAWSKNTCFHFSQLWTNQIKCVSPLECGIFHYACWRSWATDSGVRETLIFLISTHSSMRCEKSLWVVGICPSFKGIRFKLKMMQEIEWSFSVYPGNCWQPHLQVQSNHSKSSGSPFLATYLIKEYHFGIGSCGGFPDSSVGKESTCNAGDPCSIPGLGRSPGEGKGYPLQCSGLENSMDCIVHGVTKSQTQLSNFHLAMFFLFLEFKIESLPEDPLCTKW